MAFWIAFGMTAAVVLFTMPPTFWLFGMFLAIVAGKRIEKAITGEQ